MWKVAALLFLIGSAGAAPAGKWTSICFRAFAGQYRRVILKSHVYPRRRSCFRPCSRSCSVTGTLPCSGQVRCSRGSCSCSRFWSVRRGSKRSLSHPSQRWHPHQLRILPLRRSAFIELATGCVHRTQALHMCCQGCSPAGMQEILRTWHPLHIIVAHFVRLVCQMLPWTRATRWPQTSSPTRSQPTIKRMWTAQVRICEAIRRTQEYLHVIADVPQSDLPGLFWEFEA